jgi:hypothetical protein
LRRTSLLDVLAEAQHVILLTDSIEISVEQTRWLRVCPSNRKVHTDAPWDVYVWVSDVIDQKAERDALELILYLRSSFAMAVANLREFRKRAE